MFISDFSLAVYTLQYRMCYQIFIRKRVPIKDLSKMNYSDLYCRIESALTLFLTQLNQIIFQFLLLKCLLLSFTIIIIILYKFYQYHDLQRSDYYYPNFINDLSAISLFIIGLAKYIKTSSHSSSLLNLLSVTCYLSEPIV